MDFGKAFSFVFDDEEWIQKILIVALISIIPIIGQLFLFGWALEIVKRVVEKDPNPLAGYDEFGEKLVLGLKGWVVGLVYAIPVIILSPFASVPSIALAETDVAALGGLITTCFGCLIFLFLIALLLIEPVALVAMATTGDLGDAFKLGRLWEILKAGIGAFIIAILGAIVASFIGGLGGIICFIGAFFTYTYAAAVTGHLFAQAYSDGVEKAGEAAA
jgi:hypothetical protein